jgi:membrane protein DedA with SNARE-associated domain
MSFSHISSLISAHGYIVVATVVGIESMGLPLPGETTLVTAAIYAGTTHSLNIGLVVAAASIGAILGDNIGFWIGLTFGRELLARHGRFVRIDARRMKLGQYLFARHGGKVVFFGRFVALLRAAAALLAGINCMPWRRFLFFNATGGVAWASVFGIGAVHCRRAVRTAARLSGGSRSRPRRRRLRVHTPLRPAPRSGAARPGGPGYS